MIQTKIDIACIIAWREVNVMKDLDKCWTISTNYTLIGEQLSDWILQMPQPFESCSRQFRLPNLTELSEQIRLRAAQYATHPHSSCV